MNVTKYLFDLILSIPAGPHTSVYTKSRGFLLYCVSLENYFLVNLAFMQLEHSVRTVIHSNI